jgi:methyl-accepting chemotaxis protein
MKKFIPDNVMELIFGVGASIVIIGALLKITHSDLGPLTGNLMLTIGLVTEAIIFALYGIQNYYNLAEDDSNNPIETISIETKQLQEAVNSTVSGLASLNSNISEASKATSSIKVPSDLSKNTQSLSDGLASASTSIEEVNRLYDNLSKTLSQVNDATNAMSVPDGIGEELQKMKDTIKELNAKYEAMLGAMNK